MITIIGIALLPVAAADAAGGGGPTLDPTSGKNLAYALGTLALIVADPAGVQGLHGHRRGARSAWSSAPLVAFVLGDAHFDAVGASAWFGVTTPFYFGWPKFSRGRDHLDDRRHADHRRRDHR